MAAAAGFRKGWGPRDYALCANVDIPLDPERLRAFYGERFPFRVYLQYQGIQGYGWVFPKRCHVCVGIGGLLEDNRRIRPLFSQFFRERQKLGHIPSDLPEDGVYFDIDPVGAVYRMDRLTRGRVTLIGDAAGFFSGATGEGIYPGMVSAEVAAEVIHKAFGRGPVETALGRFNDLWRRPLSGYVKRLPGGGQEGKTRGRIEMIFRSPLVARLAGRISLYGEHLSVRTLARAIWRAA